MTHTALRQYPLLIESSHWIKSSFHLYPIFPMMSHCVSFIIQFLSDLSSKIKIKLVQDIFLAQLFSANLKLDRLDYSIRSSHNSHQGLNHFDYIIRVCPYYFISLRSA